MFPFIPAQMLAEQKAFGDSAMGDGVHATVFVEQPIMVQDQSSQTTYHPKNGEKACPCCQFYGVPCRQVRATEEATGQVEAEIPVAPVLTPFHHRKPFVTKEKEKSLGTQMFNLHRWYL